MNIEHVSWHSICEARSNVEWKRVRWLLTVNLEPMDLEPEATAGTKLTVL